MKRSSGFCALAVMTALAVTVAASAGCGRRQEKPSETSVPETTAETAGETGTAGETETAPETPEARPAGPEASALRVPVFSGTRDVAGPLPARYDAREAGRCAAAKDQGDLGTCWAFASLLAVESTLLPQERLDLSEDHMSNNPNFRLTQKEGGEYTMAMAYLLAWQGPVTEEQDPYGDGISPEGLAPVKHVQEIQLLPGGDLDAVKRAVYGCGGVQSSLYTTLRDGGGRTEYYREEDRSYYCPEDRIPNHDVVIVGWDDDFPKERFAAEAPGDGAFLCENSWGPQFGDDGFFYVSYYDANLGKNHVLYSSVEEPDNYDRIYQSDLCGWIGQIGYGEDTAWAANVYTAAGDERLRAAGFYATKEDTDYEVYVIREVPGEPDDRAFARRRLAAKGHLDFAGYYTVPFALGEELAAGERFAVAVKLVTPGTVHPIAIEYDAGDEKSRVDLSDGEGYISLDGDRWQRAETQQNCNLCLKAYTEER